ncbi:MAG: hypothetical protein CMH54_06040 [Myxococcales bacterium]|nr:hypothetical protein [Myxococcales bacterium]
MLIRYCTRFLFSISLVVLGWGMALAAQPQSYLLPQAGYQSGSITSGLGWTQHSGDHFVSMDVGTVVNLRAFRVGLHVPLNLRVHDGGVADDGIVRKEDWDEVSDWFRVIRFIEVGSPYTGPYYGRYGELVAATMGHGTIVDGYYNTLDPDHYQGGIQFRLDLRKYGAEFLIDNLAGPEIIGLRTFVRPLQFGNPRTDILGRTAVGLTVVSDLNAPRTLEINPDGSVVQNDVGLPQASRESTTFLGLDMEMPLVSTQEFHVIPYLDINGHIGQGAGGHLGLRNIWLPSTVFELTFRLEYQLLGEGYIPSYINNLYEVERFQYLGSQTKLSVLEDQTPQSANGVMVELGSKIFDALHVRGRYMASERNQDDAVWLQATMPYLGKVRASATYIKRNAASLGEVFDLDGALLVGDVRYRVFGALALQVLFAREWRTSQESGTAFDTVDTWQAGLVADFTL